MTWQVAKRGRERGPLPAFAKLKALIAARDTHDKALESLAQALSDFGKSVRIHVRLIAGESVEHWEVRAGSKNAGVEKKEPKEADVILVMQPQTWLAIAQGQLPPYEALYSGKLRVGGDFELAKAITRHLTDPAMQYVAPC